MATFGDRSVSGRQRHSGGVDRVRNDGGRRIGVVRNQFLEVTASSGGNRGANGRTVVVNVIDRSLENHGTRGFARINGDDLAVGQGHGHRRLSFVAQGRGVGNLPTFGDGGVSGRQRHGGGIDRVRNHSGRRISVIRDQLLEIAASRGGDGGANGRTVVVNVVNRCLENHIARGFTGINGDHLAVRQRHGHRRLRFIRKRGGVSDLTAFGDGGIGGRQRHSGGVDRVRNDGGWRIGVVRNQFLEVAASGGGDRGANGRTVVVDVVDRSLENHSARGFTRINGNNLTVRQGHGHRRLSFVAQGCGVGDLTAFGDCSIGGRQRHGGGVDRIRNDGGWRIGVVRNQLLEIAASSGGDRGTNGRTVVVDVIDRRLENHGARGFTRINGDHLTVRQRHGHRRLRFIRKRGGVSDLATFGDCSIGGRQRHGGGVDRIRNDGGRRIGVVRNQFLEVAASGGGDRGANGRTVVVNVIDRCLENHSARGFTGINGDHLAVRQGHGHRRLRFIRERGGVSDLATFSDRSVVSRQGHGGGVDRIRNDGGRRISVIRNQLLKVTASSRADGGANGGTVVVNVVNRCLENHSAGSFAGINGDHLTVRQRHGHRRLRFIRKRGGVSDLTAFGDGSVVGRQRHRSGIDRIRNHGGRRICIVRN